MAFVATVNDTDILAIATMNETFGTAETIQSYEVPGWGVQATRWSPDGRFISYESKLDGHWGIWIIDADGSNPRQITKSEGDEQSPAWSTEPSTLWYCKGKKDLWRMPMNADGEPAGPASLSMKNVGCYDNFDFFGDQMIIDRIEYRSEIWLVDFTGE